MVGIRQLVSRTSANISVTGYTRQAGNVFSKKQEVSQALWGLLGEERKNTGQRVIGT